MRFKIVARNLLVTKKTAGDKVKLPHSLQFCIDSARIFQKELLNLFSNRSYASLQLVEALAHAPKPTTVVELSQEIPFQRSYSTINKVLNAFGAESLITKTVNAGGTTKIAQSIDPVVFFKITKPFSDMFVTMLPQEVNRKFRLYALDATSNPRIHAHTLDDRSYVHQANQIGLPVTVGVEASVLTYLRIGEANWQLPVSLERIPTDTTACEIARAQLQLLDELTSADSQLNVIVADTAYGRLKSYSEKQVVIARGRVDRQGRRPAKNDQIAHRGKGRPPKYKPGIIRFIEDLPPGIEGGSDEEYEFEDAIKQRRVDVLLNRWNGVHIEGHSELVDVVKVEIFAQDDCQEVLFSPLLLILSGKRRGEITALDLTLRKRSAPSSASFA